MPIVGVLSARLAPGFVGVFMSGGVERCPNVCPCFLSRDRAYRPAEMLGQSLRPFEIKKQDGRAVGLGEKVCRFHLLFARLGRGFASDAMKIPDYRSHA